MNIKPKHIVSATAIALLLSAQVGAQSLQPNATALGLPRLKNQSPDGTSPVARSKFSDDFLNIQGEAGVRKGEKRGASFLVLEGNKEWSRSLRGRPKDTLFVSFSAYGSPGTVIDVGGARLSVTESFIPGCAQLLALNASGEWQPTGLNVPFDFYEKKILALLPVLTVRLDPASGTFDLYQSAQLLAEDLPLRNGKGGHKFTVTSGSDGAWINGLVQSDENPLYPDANANGLDDRFEQTRKGRLLTTTDTKEERKALIAQWRTDQLTHPAPVLFVNLPLPDGN